ncbi:MAG: GNAT family N-acetyltransferase [Dehalococcoidales bacterium]|nr:MAG: GNAT family N-acetyltransferase [Dehalococcoidales bacterium]
MKLEIRQAKPEEMVDFKRVAETALMFTMDDAPAPEQTLCGFIDDKLVTSYGAWPLTIVINGKDVPVAGVTMVGTLPVARRLGTLRKITSEHFEKLHEEGERSVSALYASRAAIYRRYAYSPVVTTNSYSVEPRYLEFIAGNEPEGIFREAGENDTSILVDLYDQFINTRTGYLRHSEDMWERRLSPRPQENVQQHTIIYEEDGKALGYVIYTARPTQGSWWARDIHINDLIWLTPSAYRGIWEFFNIMDILEEIKWGQVPTYDPLRHLLKEPRMLNIKSMDGVYGRIVDITGAMDKRGYDAEGKLIFRIIDDLCTWNQGTWILETSPDSAKITPCSETPQLEMPVSTLSLLYFGQVSATEAARMGRLNVNDSNSLPVWDQVMSTRYKPACADGF